MSHTYILQVLHTDKDINISYHNVLTIWNRDRTNIIILVVLTQQNTRKFLLNAENVDGEKMRSNVKRRHRKWRKDYTYDHLHDDQVPIFKLFEVCLVECRAYQKAKESQDG